MLNSITSAASGSVTLTNLLLCSALSLVLGLGVAFVYMFRSAYSKSFVMTLALLPLIVQMIILLVNGNLGTGVAIAGAFGLVRFRSVPGSAKEIVCVFFAMAIGLATGTGYLAIAAIFFVIMALVWVILTASPFGTGSAVDKELRITVPENLEFETMFDDVLGTFTRQFDLVHVKTANMGSMYQLKYRITLKKGGTEKALIDAIRCRNGNLPVSCGHASSAKEEL